MIYLLTRPIAWAVKLVMWIIKRPMAIYTSIRDRRMRKHVKALRKSQKQV
ncbi:MAG: hypothetical protein H0W87_00990 [Actinobacteria bacterium]|nr:hypothetical protein [Actinomycetota bacterium]